MHEVTIPALGMAMTEAVLTRWHKQPGDTVTVGDLVAEIETDKSVVDLESPADGTLGRHLVPEGDAVPVGDPVVRILEAGETESDGPAAALPTTLQPARAAPALQPAEVVPVHATLAAAPAVPSQPADRAPVPGRSPHKLSPRQRQLARQAAAAAGPQPAAMPAATATVTVTEPPPDPGRTRLAIASRVSQSWREIPHFAVEREIDATDAAAALAALRLREPAATYTDLLLRALAVALQHTVGGSGDLGLAVAAPAGVLMPVVVRVPDLSPSQLVAARLAAVERARYRRLNGADVSGTPLASLSNLGSHGVDAFTGVIAVGQQLLLTVGTIRPRPVVLDGGLHVRPTLIATLNVDHRSFDGDRAADVLAAFDRAFGTSRAWVEGEHA